MGSDWFVKTDKVVAGPFSSEQMIEFVRAGRVRAATLVRKGADGSWRPAERIRGLLSASATTGPSPPTLSVLGHRIDPTWAFAATIIAGGLLLSSCILVLGLRSSNPKEIANSAGSPAPTAPQSDAKSPETQADSGLNKPALKNVPASDTASVQADRPTGHDRETLLPRVPEMTNAGSEVAEKPAVSKSPARPPNEPVTDDVEPNPQQSVGPRKLPPPPRTIETRSSAEVIAEVEPSVALIEGDGSSGTGFVIDAGVVLTNKHVLHMECIDTLRVYFPSAEGEFRRPQSARLLFKDPKRDLAYLQVENTPPPLRFTADLAFKRGQEVTVVGNPGMADGRLLVNAVSKGVMSTEVTIEGIPYFQLGISINPGNSGGPVLDSDGSVIGVVTLKDPKKEGMGFCIPPSEVVESIGEMKLVPEGQISRINDDHDLQVVLFRVVGRGVMAKVRMDSLVEAMTRAIDSGGTADDGVETVRQRSGLNISSQEQTRAMQAAVTRIVRNSRYPEQTRQQLADLWATVQSIVSYAQEPRGSVKTYREKALELQDEFSRQFQRLRVLVGSPFDE